MVTFGRRVYGREELLLLGRSVLCSETTYRVPTSAWLNIKYLGVATAKDTKRGTRGGKNKKQQDRGAGDRQQAIPVIRSDHIASVVTFGRNSQVISKQTVNITNLFNLKTIFCHCLDLAKKLH